MSPAPILEHAVQRGEAIAVEAAVFGHEPQRSIGDGGIGGQAADIEINQAAADLEAGRGLGSSADIKSLTSAIAERAGCLLEECVIAGRRKLVVTACALPLSAAIAITINPILLPSALHERLSRCLLIFKRFWKPLDETTDLIPHLR